MINIQEHVAKRHNTHRKSSGSEVSQFYALLLAVFLGGLAVLLVHDFLLYQAFVWYTESMGQVLEQAGDELLK